MVPHDMVIPASLTAVALLTASLFPDPISWLLGMAALLAAFGLTRLISHGRHRATRSKDGP